MSIWKCRYCGAMSANDEISDSDGVCLLHPAGVGNHHFIKTSGIQELADKSNWREGDNGLWHWKGTDPPFVIAAKALAEYRGEK